MKKIKKQVKVCRASGMPVQVENIEKYQTDFKNIYSKVMKKCGVNEESNEALTEPQAKRCNG